MLGVTLQWISISSRGESSNTPSHFMLKETRALAPWAIWAHIEAYTNRVKHP